MKISKILTPVVSLALIVGATLPTAGTMVTTLPASLAAPLNSSTNRGFLVRTAQAWTTNGPVGNSYLRVYKQLNGTLLDTNNTLIINAAVPGPNADGSYTVDTVNFEKDGSGVNITDGVGNTVAVFSSPFFPGIPGPEGNTDNFAVEVVTFLTLKAGSNVFGISSGADRTDANNDDGFLAFVAPNPRDFFGTQVSAAEKNTSSPFGSNQSLETQLILIAPQAGIYPFRIVYWQTGLGANLQFYSIDEAGTRVLVNDPNDVTAVPAYIDSNVAIANAPYVAETSPIPGSAGNPANAPIDVLLIDGKTTVNLSTISLSLNGTLTSATKAKNGTRTTVTYSPPPQRTDPNNAIQLSFQDSASATFTFNWAFTITVTGGNANNVAGQWDFDHGDLRATIGQDLHYLDATFDGPGGSASDKTQFGTTVDFGIPNINGQIARVMRVPGGLDARYGYEMHHGIAPNGGGTRVNQYTLVMDVMVDDTGAGAASLLRIQPTGASDGDLFWQGNNFGQGGNGYNGKGTFTPKVWHRVVAAYDEAANPPAVTKYVDGIKQDDWTANQGLDNPRRALLPVAYLFADGTPTDERRQMWLKSVQIRPGKLTDTQIVLLGGPDAAGIPVDIPTSSVAGQWDFEFGDLSPTIGKPLTYIDPTLDGPAAIQAGTAVADPTSFGTCSALGVSLINGVDANIMHVPGDLLPGIGYVMDHGIAPNGGGTKVNQYTLLMEVMVDDTGPGAASLWRVQPPGASDGDLFWQGNNFGQGGNGYNGKGTFTPKVWHRVVAAYDEAANPPVVTKYVDGIKQDDWTANQGLDNPRRAMAPLAYLFADGTPTDERRTMWVKSIQIRAGKMADAQIVALGKPDGHAIPVATPQSTVAGQWDFENGDLSATIGKSLEYLDPTLDGPAAIAGGTAVPDPTSFGTCSALGVGLISTVDAKVMHVPGDLLPGIGYVMTHGIAPNGGGTRVNQYTLLMDVYVDVTGSGAASLWRVQPTGASDGDLFWQGNNFGQGGNGYNGTDAFTAGAWHRIVAAYDEAASTPVVTKYVDAIFQDNWTANQGLDNPRRALLPQAFLFADGTPTDERRTMWVKSVQIRSNKMANADIEALGVPDGNPIPVTGGSAPAPSIKILPNVNGAVILLWPVSVTGYALESTSDLSQPASWQPVSGVVNNSIQVPVGPGAKYYRLKK